jgi:Na+-translocating ferredoxin:NAD+ oxidoreductase RNF subunit RnfB
MRGRIVFADDFERGILKTGPIGITDCQFEKHDAASPFAVQAPTLRERHQERAGCSLRELIRCIRFRQADAVVGIGEVLGEMLAVQRLNASFPVAALTQRSQQIHPHRMQLPKIHDHFREIESRAFRRVIPSEHTARANMAAYLRSS